MDSRISGHTSWVIQSFHPLTTNVKFYFLGFLIQPHVSSPLISYLLLKYSHETVLLWRQSHLWKESSRRISHVVTASNTFTPQVGVDIFETLLPAYTLYYHSFRKGAAVQRHDVLQQQSASFISIRVWHSSHKANEHSQIHFCQLYCRGESPQRKHQPYPDLWCCMTD